MCIKNINQGFTSYKLPKSMAEILIIMVVKVETPCSTREKGLWESAETRRQIHLCEHSRSDRALGSVCALHCTGHGAAVAPTSKLPNKWILTAVLIST